MENVIASPTQQNTAVVAFRLDQRTFALPLDVIVQILPMMIITPIPHMTRIVKGTINIRGEDVLVINLRSHFGLEEIELQLYTPLLLLKLNGRLLALIVDAVLDVMNLPLEKVTSLQNILPEGIENIPMLRGVSYHNDESILVLEPDHLFYNQHALIQYPIEPRANVVLDMPVAEKKPVAKKTPAAKKIPVAVSAPVEDVPAVTSAPVEDVPVAINAPIEDMPVAADASVEDASAATSVPAEDTSAPFSSDPPVTLENE